ncbi:MAG: Ig-like domain-containing protein, partial [Verrucomicrobiota bacterium]
VSSAVSGAQAVSTNGVTAVVGEFGTLEIDSNGAFVYTPFAGAKGVDTFTYTVSDGKGGVATETLKVEIQGAESESNFSLFSGSGILQSFRFAEPISLEDPTDIDRESPSAGPILTMMPVFTGIAEPGTVVTVKVVGVGGEVLPNGVSTAIAGNTGGWVAKFENLLIESDQVHRVVIEESEPEWRLGNPNRGIQSVKSFFVPEVNDLRSLSEGNLSVNSVFGRRLSSSAMDTINEANLYPNGKPNIDWRISD